MKKFIRSLMSFLLIISVVLIGSLPALANEVPVTLNSGDAYTKNLMDKVSLGNVEYIYGYDINDEGNRTIVITNEDNGTVTDIEFVEDDQGNTVVYCNGEVIGGYYKVGGIVTSYESDTLLRAGWVSMGPTEYKYVSWSRGTSASVVAGIIGSACGGLTAAQITSVVGSGTLSTLGSSTSGGTLTLNRYYMNSGGSIQYMYVFGITDTSNIYHGAYTVYSY